MQLTPAFKRSYENFESYPRHLVHQRLYAGIIQNYQARLREAVPRLFVHDDNATNIKCRDFGYRGEELDKADLVSDLDLKEQLGDTTLSSSNTPNQSSLVGRLATARDPKCRFIFLLPKDSRSKLPITQRSLARLMSYHQVMPEYLDLLLTFGDRIDSPDPTCTAFRALTTVENPNTELRMPELGRSGSEFQMCYILRAVAYKPNDQMWSIRPAAFHHQFDIDEARALWVTTTGASSGLYDRIKLTTADIGRPADRDFRTPNSSLQASFTIHLLHAHWAMEHWTSYLQCIKNQLKEKTDAALDDRRTLPNRKEFNLDDLQQVQKVVERIDEAIITLDGNIQVLNQIHKFYRSLLQNRTFHLRSGCRSQIRDFLWQLKDIESSLTSDRASARHLRNTAVDRKELILQYLQGQATQNTEYLSVDMRSIAIKSRHEAVIVRIITIITLIYLPGTFVSTFFSTDVIKYEGTQSGVFSNVAMWRWLQVTLALTAVTVALAGWLFVQSWQKSRRERMNLIPKFIMREDV